MPSAAQPLSKVGPRPCDGFRLRKSKTHLNQRLSFPRSDGRNSVKQWDAPFFSSTDVDEQPFVKTWQNIGADGDLLDIFLRGSGSPRNTWISDVVKSFCHEHRLEVTGHDNCARAWLDDRDVRTEQERKYSKWQTAQELRSVLGKPVREISGLTFKANSGIAVQSLRRTRRA
jgi:hypothetical protein